MQEGTTIPISDGGRTVGASFLHLAMEALDGLTGCSSSTSCNRLSGAYESVHPVHSMNTASRAMSPL